MESTNSEAWIGLHTVNGTVEPSGNWAPLWILKGTSLTVVAVTFSLRSTTVPGSTVSPCSMPSVPLGQKSLTAVAWMLKAGLP